MRPLVLKSLRCPRRCLLGTVVASADGPQLLIRRKVIVQTGLDAVHSQVQHVGPFPLAAPGLVDFGCTHTTGEALDDTHLGQIRKAVDAVRRGEDTPGGDLILRPHHGGPVA